ncbi:MAG: hypothetical protein Q9183_000272 [Haloplaca sp. 2 TL-2023]
MRFGLYVGASTVLAGGALVRACLERPNFYSSSVYIAQSNACLFILTNLALLSTYTIVLGLQKAFYGPLRPVEVEQLWEKAWFAYDHIQRRRQENVGGWFLFMFTFLLISKVWNWLAEGRVEILEQQPPANPRLFHARLATALTLSVLFNLFMLRFSIGTVLQQARPNMMVMFAFEFAVLTILSLSTAARYTLSLYEAAVIKRQVAQGRERLRNRREDPLPEEEVANIEIDAAGWEEKGQWVFYLDIATDFFKLVLYVTFFCVLCIFYGMPIHIIRDVALTVRSFYKRVHDFVQYKQATRDMNARYPDATVEEISREDVCIICRENMKAWQDSTTRGDLETPRGEHRPVDERQRAKKLPCGHLLHFACLRSWLERQQICPTCRMPVLSGNRDRPNPPAAAGGNAQGAPQAVNPPAAGPHVYTFGPLRLVFGARQINDGPRLNPVANEQATNPPEPDFPQRNAVAVNSVGVQAQLSQIEQHLSREIVNLNHVSSQLQVVRALQAELARLRAVQGIPDGHVPTWEAQSRQIPSQQTALTLQGYRQVPLSQERRNMPAGITVPEGWTLHALERVPGSAIPDMTANANAESTSRERRIETGGTEAQPTTAMVPEQQSSIGLAQPKSLGNGAGASNIRFGGASASGQGQATSNEGFSELPEWAAAEGIEGTSSKRKGKGRTVTVEDDVEDAGER